MTMLAVNCDKPQQALFSLRGHFPYLMNQLRLVNGSCASGAWQCWVIAPRTSDGLLPAISSRPCQ